jgi:hypothetical protein
MAGTEYGQDMVNLVLALARAGGGMICEETSSVDSSELASSLGALRDSVDRLYIHSSQLGEGDDTTAMSTAAIPPGPAGIREEPSGVSSDGATPGTANSAEVEVEITSARVFAPAARRNLGQAASFYDEYSIDAAAILDGGGPHRDEGASVQQLLSGETEGPKLRPVNISELNMFSRSRGRALSAGVRILPPHPASAVESCV